MTRFIALFGSRLQSSQLHTAASSQQTRNIIMSSM